MSEDKDSKVAYTSGYKAGGGEMYWVMRDRGPVMHVVRTCKTLDEARDVILAAVERGMEAHELRLMGERVFDIADGKVSVWTASTGFHMQISNGQYIPTTTTTGTRGFE